MKRFSWSLYGGLLLTGIIASAALLIEARLQVSSDIHFFLQFVWIGVVGAALLAFAITPALQNVSAAPPTNLSADPVAEFLDEDRLWLQAHPDSAWNEQV